MTEPKIAPLGGCYNYKRLEKEGLVEEKETKSEEDGLDYETDAYDQIPSRYWGKSTFWFLK